MSVSGRVKQESSRKSDDAISTLPINEQLRQVEILLNVSKQVASFERLHDMLNVIVEMTTHETGAERGSLFLNDPETGELYSRVAQGSSHREIRILNNVGIAGHVFTTGKSAIVHDTYADDRFDRTIDQKTGYVTKSILCSSVRTVKGEVIGVIQALNKKKGKFSKKDLHLIEAMTTQAAITLQSARVSESVE